MLHQLPTFTPGEAFIPPREAERLADVSDLLAMHAGDYTDPKRLKGRARAAWSAAFERIRRDDGSEHVVTVNLYRVTVQTLCDLLLGEPSEIRAKTDDGEDALHEWSEREGLWAQLYEGVTDAMVTGDSYARVVDDAGQARLTMLSPKYVWPVCSRDDVRKPVGYVLAWRYNEGTPDRPDWRATVEVHEVGYYTRYSLILDRDGKKVKRVEDETRYPGVPGRLSVVHLASPNRRTDCYHGISELDDIDPIVQEITVRLSQAARILDKHSDPSMNAPESAFEYDAVSGAWQLKAGGAFITGEGESGAEYVTWDGQLTPNREQVTMLLDQWMTAAALSPALFAKGQNAASGAALKRLMIPTLAKVNRWRQALTPFLREICALVDAIERTGELAILDWSDGLPEDPTEQAQAEAILRAAGLASREASIGRLTGLSGDELAAEVARIEAEERGAPVAEPL